MRNSKKYDREYYYKKRARIFCLKKKRSIKDTRNVFMGVNSYFDEGCYL